MNTHRGRGIVAELTDYDRDGNRRSLMAIRSLGLKVSYDKR